MNERRSSAIGMKKNNSLKNLSKLELLELLAEQEREIQELKHQLEEKNKLLAQRTLCMEHAGNIAQAALALNGVFEAAQRAADQYLTSVKAMTDRELRQEKPHADEVSAPGVCRQSMPPLPSAEQSPATAKDTQTATPEEPRLSFSVDEILAEVRALREESPPKEQEGKL